MRAQLSRFACLLIVTACGDSAGPSAEALDGAAPLQPIADAQSPLDATTTDTSAPFTCPTSAPFDDTDPRIVGCTHEVIVGVGNALRRVVSRDEGSTWPVDVAFPNAVPDQNENSHRDVAVARGIVVVVGDGGILVSSDGGASFKVADAGRHHDSSVAYFQGAFWVISNLGTYTSSDGVTWKSWTGQTMLPGNLPGGYSSSSIATSATALVALDSRNTAIRTFDGSTWKAVTLGASYSQLGQVAYGNGHFLMIGYGCCNTQPFAGLRATSADGASWNLVTNATAPANQQTYRFGQAVWNGTQFLVTASQYDSRTYSTPDGTSWTVNKSDTGLGSVAVVGAGYVAAGAASIYRSSDGAKWTLLHGPGSNPWGFTRIATGRVLP